jgi:hypothetical protein
MTYKYLETEVVVAMNQQFARQLAELRIAPIPISSRLTKLSFLPEMKQSSGVSSISCPQMAFISSGNEATLWS